MLFRRKTARPPPRARLAALLSTPRVPPGLAATLAGRIDSASGSGPCSSRGVEGAWSPGSAAPAAAVLDALAPAVAWAENGSRSTRDALDAATGDLGVAQRFVAGAIMGDNFGADEAALLIFGAAVGEESKVDRRAIKAVYAACGAGVAPGWRRPVEWRVARMWMRSGGRACLKRVVHVGKEARKEWEARGRFEVSVEYCDLEFEGKIGEGAFAEVWKGKWMAAEVAIKRFHGDISLLDGAKRTNRRSIEHRLDLVADLFRKREGRRRLPGGEGRTGDKEASDKLLLYASRVLTDDANGDGQAHRAVSHKDLNMFLSDSNREKYRSFLAEVAALKKLTHPNIAKFLGAVVDPVFNPLCIVTELFEGGSLHDYLHTKKKFVPKRSEALRMAVSIARGMSYLYSHKPPLLHRDIKPRNVLLSSGVDGKPRVALCDFGMCKLFFDCDDSDGQSAENEAMGTVTYMSPNVLAGDNFCSADDVYSFGILLCELLTGRLPYEGVRPINVIFGVAEDGLRPEIQDEDNICDDLRELIVGCWREELTDRPNILDVTTCLSLLYEKSLNTEEGDVDVGIVSGGKLLCKRGGGLDLVMIAPEVDFASSLSADDDTGVS